MPRRFTRWLTVLVASSVAVLAPVPLLTQSAEAAEPTDSLQQTVDAYLDLPANGRAAWQDCPPKANLASLCASITVPMDWQNPAKGNIRLAAAYLETAGPSKGLLTTNPGGPGAAGRSLTESLGWSKTRLMDNYDLLGFDPRGFGLSTKVSCKPLDLKKLPNVADRRVRNRATHAMEIAEAKTFGAACATEPSVGHRKPEDDRIGARYVTTQQTVWDVDFLRQVTARAFDKGALYDKLNYVGYSYGTWLGAWYADTFPDRVGRFILDSNMQWTSSMYVNQTLDSASFQRRRDKMLFPYLARHNSYYKLGKSTTSVKKKYESTRKKLATQAKKDLKKGKTPVMGPEDLDYITASLIYSDEAFPSAGYIIGSAADYAKKPSSKSKQRSLAKKIAPRLDKAPFTVQRAGSKVAGSKLSDITEDVAGTIVRCNDSAQPGNLTALLKRADRDAKKYPFTGYLNTVPLCAYWKFKPQTRTIDLTGLNTKMLMLQSEGDPATAYEGALAAHRRTATKTVLVSVDNEGQHGLYIDGPSPCLEAIGDRFLFTGTLDNPVLPTRDTRCGTSPLPDDRKVYPLSGPVSGTSANAAKAVKTTNAKVRAVRADVAKRGLS